MTDTMKFRGRTWTADEVSRYAQGLGDWAEACCYGHVECSSRQGGICADELLSAWQDAHPDVEV